MGLLYDVYRHPVKGDWGVTKSGSTICFALVTGVDAEVGEIPASKLAMEVAKRLRQGFKKLAKAKYLRTEMSESGTLRGDFIDKHPELAVREGLVLYTALAINDDVKAIVGAMEETLWDTDAPSEALQSWEESAEQAKQYIVAPRSTPVIALVVAEWAIANGRLLLADKEDMPVGQPSHYPMQWADWLQKFFPDRTECLAALQQLGIGVSNVVQTNVAEIEAKREPDQTWLVSAAQITF